MKAKYFKKSELEDLIFHLEVIIQTTEKYKVSRKTSELKILFIDILKYEYKEESKKAIIGKLTKYLQKKRNKDRKEQEEKEVNEKRRSTENTRRKGDSKKIRRKSIKCKGRANTKTKKENSKHREQ